MHLQTALVSAGLGLVGGSFVPSMIAGLPEPEPDPDENEGDFPDKVPYSDLAEHPGLGWKASLSCAVLAAVLGGAIGWHWGLSWLLVLVPIGAALAVVDFVTWYLPRPLINPAFTFVIILEIAAAFFLKDWTVLRSAVVGFLVLGAYYGLLNLISPRIMAYGDVRLGALLGLALGPFGITTVILSIFTAAVVGVIAWPPLKAMGNTIRKHYPFGPFLLVGAWVAVLLDLWINSIAVT